MGLRNGCTIVQVGGRCVITQHSMQCVPWHAVRVADRCIGCPPAVGCGLWAVSCGLGLSSSAAACCRDVRGLGRKGVTDKITEMKNAHDDAFPGDPPGPVEFVVVQPSFVTYAGGGRQQRARPHLQVCGACIGPSGQHRCHWAVRPVM
jgi:hypothetical protein